MGMSSYSSFQMHFIFLSQAPTSGLKPTVPAGKAPPATAATPQAAPPLGSPRTPAKKHELQPAQNTQQSQAQPGQAQLSQTVTPAQAEESSDSSSSSDSEEEETPQQTPRPGQFSQEDALRAVGQSRVGTVIFFILWNTCYLHVVVAEVFPSPVWHGMPLSVEGEAFWWQ